MPKALATCAIAEPDDRAVSAVLRELDAYACEDVVLDAAVGPVLFEAWVPRLAGGEPRVRAIEAPCPRPVTSHRLRVFRPEDAGLASPDRGTRADALALVRPTLDVAEMLSVPVVVLTGGPLPVTSAVLALERFAGAHAFETPDGSAALGLARRLRAEAGAAAVDGWSFALETLLAAAERRGLTLALAEQPHPDWAGSPAELAVLLGRFAGAPLTWWADPLGREATDRLLGAWDPRPVPAGGPSGVVWRAPGAAPADGRERLAEDLRRWHTSGEGEGALAVLAPADGRLQPWHRALWDALPS